MRERAKEIGDETVVVAVRRFGGQGDSVDAEPELRYRRTVLFEEAAAADQRSSWLDGYLARGDALDSQTLGGLVGALELVPA